MTCINCGSENEHDDRGVTHLYLAPPGGGPRIWVELTPEQNLCLDCHAPEKDVVFKRECPPDA